MVYMLHEKRLYHVPEYFQRWLNLSSIFDKTVVHCFIVVLLRRNDVNLLKIILRSDLREILFVLKEMIMFNYGENVRD